MPDTDRIYLIAHSGEAGRGIAQARIPAADLAEARRRFAAEYPDRRITATGIQGVDDPVSRSR